MMKRSRFTEQQIASTLQQAEQGTQVAGVTHKMGISEPTFYRWKKYGGLMPSEVRGLRQLEEENAGQRRLMAGLSLAKEMLQEVIRKSSKACSGAAGCGVFAHLLSGEHPAGLGGGARSAPHPLLSVPQG